MGRPKGSRNKPKQPVETSQNPPVVSEVKEKPKRAQKAVSGAKKATGAAAKAARQKALSPAPEQVAKNTKFQNTETSGNSQTQQRAIIDLNTGQILGPDKSIDLTAPSTERYSHSFIGTIATCTAQALFRRQHAPARKVYALERGSCLHSLIEAFEVEHKDPLQGLPDAWRHYLTDHMDEFSPEDQEKIQKGYDDNARILEEFVHENADILPRIRKEDVEVPFDMQVTINTAKGPIKRTVVGKIDLVLWDLERTSYGIIDHKSNAQAPSAGELALNCQFAIYQKAATELYGFPPRYMNFYLLNGQHLCKERFSSKAHPRPIKDRVPGCELSYSLKVPRKTPEQIQELIDLYYGNQILKWEAGIIGKDGLHDPKNACLRCQYFEHCQTVKSFPAPRII